uniref:RRM domain-containing protein n=1 Tax=Panagrellus redivivus TaxID=6233 RepID=A0A7E4V231_PANRE
MPSYSSSSRGGDRTERDREPRRRSRSPRSRSREPTPNKRLHLADLDETVTSTSVREAFGKFGKLADVWVASYPPYFGFVVYENADDASDALKSMRRGYIGNCHIRVTIALPRGSRRSPRPFRRDDRGGGGGYERRGYGGGGGRGGGGGYRDRRSPSPYGRRGGRDGGGYRDRGEYRRRSRSRSPPPRPRRESGSERGSRRRVSPVASDVSE